MRNAAFDKIVDLAKADKRVILAASDIAADAVARFRCEVPKQFFMEGIAEGHLIGMACGLAKEGNIVFVNTIASFLSKRCLEQIAINLCLEKSNVKLLAQGGGLLYGRQGPTHHANEDIALMRALPNMTVMAPCDTEQVKHAVEFAYRYDGPVYIRMSKGSSTVISRDLPFNPSCPVIFKDFGDVVFIATGTMVQVALQVSERIRGSGVVGVHTLKPFYGGEIAKIIERAKVVITLEEHSEVGGLATCVCETIVKGCSGKPVFISFALKDAFVSEYGDQNELLRLYGLDAESIYEEIRCKL